MDIRQEKQDNENYSKNFTRIPNILFVSYEHLSHEEKFLYCKLRNVYWDARPRFASLRDISRLTGYAISAMSRILPRLHKCGLIHAEIMQEHNPNGTKKGKPRYHITIPDIWELNRKYFECSPEERFDPSDVLLKNDNVLQKNVNVPVENVIVPPEEHFSGNQAPSQARSQAAKDSNKIIKDREKEGAPDSSLPSSSQSSSLIANPATEKIIESKATRNTSSGPITEPLTPQPDPEATRVFNLLCEVFYAIPPEVITEKIKKQCASLAPFVRNAEDLKNLRDYARAEIMEDPRYKKKRVYLGNLVEHLDGWKQEREPLPEKSRTANPSKPSSVSGMRNYTFDPEAQPATQEPPPGELVAVPGFSLKALREQRKKERMNA